MLAYADTPALPTWRYGCGSTGCADHHVEPPRCSRRSTAAHWQARPSNCTTAVGGDASDYAAVHGYRDRDRDRHTATYRDRATTDVGARGDRSRPGGDVRATPQSTATPTTATATATAIPPHRHVPRPRYRHTATYRDRATTGVGGDVRDCAAVVSDRATAPPRTATARLHHRVPRPRDRVRRRSRPRRNTRLPRDGSDGVGDGRVTADQIQRQSRRPRRIQERQQH